MLSVVRDLIPRIKVQHQQSKTFKWVSNILFGLSVVVSEGLVGGRVMVNKRQKLSVEFRRSCHGSIFSQIPSPLSQQYPQSPVAAVVVVAIQPILIQSLASFHPWPPAKLGRPVNSWSSC